MIQFHKQLLNTPCAISVVCQLNHGILNWYQNTFYAAVCGYVACVYAPIMNRPIYHLQGMAAHFNNHKWTMQWSILIVMTQPWWTVVTTATWLKPHLSIMVCICIYVSVLYLYILYNCCVLVWHVINRSVFVCTLEEYGILEKFGIYFLELGYSKLCI